MKNMKIGARLSLGFILLIMLLLGMAGVGVYQLKTIDDGISSMMTNSVNVERSAREWARSASSQGLIVYAFSYATQPEMIQQFAKQFIQYREEINERLKEIESSKLVPDELQMLREIAAKREVYRVASSKLFEINNVSPTGELIGEQPPFSILRDHLMNNMVPARNAYIQAVDRFRDYQINQANQTRETLTETYLFARTELMVVAGIATLMGLLLAWRLMVGITQPLKEAVRIAETVASGDLTSRIEVKTSDETGQLMQAMKNMNEYLFNAVTQVRQSADTIETASSQIASGNQDLSARTEQQAGSLEETASSMEEITSTVRQNGDNARQANQLTSQAVDTAAKGGEAAGLVADTMKEIEDSSRKIVNIISVIDSIAFQTNILALNAAVEAARAGEQGRGFAVVATEVRSLAQRSATAAREIKDLIDDSVSKVSTGTELVNNAVNTMLEIGESIRQVNDIMSEISMATQEQVQGIEQVNQAVTEIDTASQQNAALVEEAAAAAESLQDQARTLVGVVSMFDISSGVTSRPVLSVPVSDSARPAAKPVVAPSKETAPAVVGSAPVSSSDDGSEWEEF